MSGNNDRITTAQAAVIIINYILGAGILTLPRTTVEAVKTPDVWISILISGGLVFISGMIIVILCRKFPGKTIFQFAQEITGKWISVVLAAAIISYFVTIAAFEIRIMAEVTGLYLLEGTPKWAIILVFMWIGFYLISGGINSIARLYEIILPITLVFFTISILLSIRIFDIDNLRPVLGSGIVPILKGVKSTLLAFTGYEILLVVMAFMSFPKKGMKAMSAGILTSLGIYLITLIMVLGGLSIDGVVTKTWPTLDLMRSFEMEGLIFERFESLLLVIWIMQIFSTYTITHYAASLGCAQLLKKKMQPFMLGMLPVIYIIAMVPQSLDQAFKLGDFLGSASIYLFGAVPVLLLLLCIVRKKGLNLYEQP